MTDTSESALQPLARTSNGPTHLEIERRQAEEALRESEARFRNLLQNVPSVAVQGYGPDGTVQYWNRASEILYGYTAEEAIGRNLVDLIIPPEMRGAVAQAVRQMIQSGQPIPAGELTLMRKDGSRVEVFSSHTVVQKPGRESELFCIDIDITERKRTEEALRTSEEKFRKIFENVQDVFYEVTLDGVILEVSPSIEAVSRGQYRRGELIGKSLFDFYADIKERESFLKVLQKEGRVADYEIKLRNRDGSVVPCSISSKLQCDAQGNPIKIIGSMRDITERKHVEEENTRLELQLRQAQKMESVGQLAGGVAHDFNNMLQAILGNIALVLEDLPSGSPWRENLEEAQKCAQRSTDLTRQLLVFARKQTVAPKVLDINATVDGMLKMLRRLIGEDIELIWEPGAELYTVKIDPSQIDQVLANLCVNARDAIGGVGKVTLQTQNVTFNHLDAECNPGIVPGEYVMLAVRDTGCGMTKEVLGHLFEPFFTTKGVGKGTGLGLATVYGIVQQNKGIINVDSHPGQGSTFRIYLPRHAGKVTQETPKSVSQPADGGNETILLVEDEPAILGLGKRSLEKLGYRVLACQAPMDAIRLAHDYKAGIHLLVTDVVMPEMNGQELASQLLSSHPKLKRLFMSGYTDDVIAHHGVLEEGIHFLEKPFTIDALARKVREVLESKG